MIKQLTTLALGVALSSMVLSGTAQACHKPKCAKPVAACAPVVYAAPAPVAYCAPAPKKACCFKMPKLTMPKLCHKKVAAPCTTVAYAAPVSYAPAPSAQSWASPQK